MAKLILRGIKRHWERKRMVDGTDSLQTLDAMKDWLHGKYNAHGECTIVETTWGARRYDWWC
jgi:hypothetical protein